MSQNIRVTVEITVDVKVEKDSWDGHKEAEDKILCFVNENLLGADEESDGITMIKSEVTSTEEN